MECNCIKTVENSDVSYSCMEDIAEAIKKGNIPEEYELLPTYVNSNLLVSKEKYLALLKENSKIKLMQACKGSLLSDLKISVLSRDFWCVSELNGKPDIPPYIWVHCGDPKKFDSLKDHIFVFCGVGKKRGDGNDKKIQQKDKILRGWKIVIGKNIGRPVSGMRIQCYEFVSILRLQQIRIEEK